MAAASPSARRRGVAEGGGGLRPLSAALLLAAPDPGGGGDERGGGGPPGAGAAAERAFENGAFELGSPERPAPAAAPPAPLAAPDPNNNGERAPSAETAAADARNNNADTTEAGDAPPPLACVNGNVMPDTPPPQIRTRETNSAPELTSDRRRSDASPARPPPAVAHAGDCRPHWAMDSARGTAHGARAGATAGGGDVWRRRRTDPAGDTKYYHRDYREALSSLLWQPYDCRDQSNQTSSENVCSLDDDADVSLWLSPQPLSGAARRSGARAGGGPLPGAPPPGVAAAPAGRASSSASSTSSGSSGSCSGWRAGESAWSRPNALSSLWRPLRPANLFADPNPRAQDVVTDLHLPWLGTTTTGGGGGRAAAVAASSGARSLPPAGALASRAAAEACELCCGPQCASSQRPASGVPVRAADSECCLCCAEGPAAAPRANAMLVTVDPPPDAAGAERSASPTPASPPAGTSVSVVNCYRAVPVVVSAVPTIPCLNTSGSSSNVCNVNIVQTTPADAVRVSAAEGAPTAAPRGRTFTSTEAQTDDFGPEAAAAAVAAPGAGRVGAAAGGGGSGSRERRRRERRERRQRRHNAHGLLHAPPPHPHEAPPPPPGAAAAAAVWQTQLLEPHLPPAAAAGAPGADRLPDILNSHLPPPYSTLPLGLAPPPPVAAPPPHPHLGPPPVAVPLPVGPALPGAAAAPGSPPPPPPPHHHPGGMRFPFQLTPGGRRRSRGHHYTPEEEPKTCCGVVVTQTVSIRWFIVMIAFVGICCAVVGTVLGAMKASGREHLTVSLLMIGVGIVLITVSGVAWRLTAHDAPSCRMMLGLGGGDDSGAEPNRRFVPRLPPSYGRPHHPYAAMMYPEFQYRPPPPSYQASMQEYRLRLLLLDRHPGGSVTGPGQTATGHIVSPPPTYRSHAGSTLSRAPLGLRRDQMQSDYSRPPSYRSRTSSTRPTLDPNGNIGCSTAEHSRDPSLSLSESGGGSAVVNVISVMGNGGSEAENLDNIKMLPDQDVPLRMMLNKGCHSSNMNVRSSVDEAKDANLVTIVQTGNDTSPVIVTVSGSTMATTTGSSTSTSGVDTEMEILAHL